MTRLASKLAALPLIAMLASGCDGIFSGIYDQAPTTDITDEGFSPHPTDPNRLTLTIDASDFGMWHYVSLKDKTVEKLPIPLACEGEWDGRSGITYQEVKGSQYTPLSSITTDPQPEPDRWDLAIHRFDARSNGGAVSRTELTSLDDLHSLRCDAMDFVADTWSDTTVMVDLKDMMAYRIGYQNSWVNAVLSEWVTMDISTPPPSFEATGLVYILRMADGSMAALRMRSYINERGEKGHLTIDIIYPWQ